LAESAREYELVLMLDPAVEESRRDELAGNARAAIEQGGELKAENAWGLRKLAYEIKQRNEADYRWYRFGAPTELLTSLDHNLKITDGILRFRIFKVDPDSQATAAPPAVTSGPPAGREGRGPRDRDGDRDGDRGDRSERSEAAAETAAQTEPPAEPAVEAAPPAEAPAEPGGAAAEQAAEPGADAGSDEQ
jgi:small subunit ribosomal protein S6